MQFKVGIGIGEGGV